MRRLSLLAGICVLGTVLQAQEFGENVRGLGAFGDISTAPAARAALQSGIAKLTAAGGGVIVIPPEAPLAMQVRNTSQTDRNGPGVTVIDLRRGFIDTHLPALGKQQTSAWGGQRIQRTVNLIPQHSRIPFQGVYPAQSIQNYVVSGSSSYDASLTRPVSKGKDRRIYVDLIRGIYPGQYLTVTSNPIGYAPPYDRVLVKAIGWDDEAKRNYFTADLQYDHPAGALAYNKHLVNGMQIEGNSNADNQTMEFQVMRRIYGVGDSFGVSSTMKYMSDIFSGFGDEGACVINAESIGELDSFHSTVVSVDWSRDAIVYAPGYCMPQTLSSSRPLINMNRDKWHTTGNVYIVSPSGTWRGQRYPGRIGGLAHSFNYLGGAIIGTPDCGWTRDIIGRFFALTDPTEVLSPKDRSTAGGYAKLPRRPVYRWYRVMELEQTEDGRPRIRILRVRWSAVAAGAPKLFRDDNYTWDGHEKPLDYAIAPGAWVYDISAGWADALSTGGYVGPSHPRTLRVTPHADRGTPADFAPGDPIEQAVGPDPWHPVPLRIRQFDQMPTTMDGASIEIHQLGRVQVPSAIVVTGITRSLEDLARRKDRKPAFDTLARFASVARIGIRFESETQAAALLFDQPRGRPQPIWWHRAGGTSSLQVRPNGEHSGDFVFSGGNISLSGHSARQIAGVSGSETPARNLRGINVPVPEGATQLTVNFPVPEHDADYAVTVQPNWMTMDRTAAKAADGFTVAFSVPAPANGTLDWHLLR